MTLKTRIYAPSMASLINENKKFFEELDFNNLISIRYENGVIKKNIY